MSNSEFPDPDEMRRAKVRNDGYVIDDKGEEAHMVTHISGSTSILVPDDQDDSNRYPFLHLTLFFRDGHPPVTALLNPAFVIGLMGDCVAMFKTMMGVEDVAVVPDTVPDFDDMPLAPDDPYSYSEPQPDDYGHDSHDSTEEIPPPGEDDYHG